MYSRFYAPHAGLAGMAIFFLCISSSSTYPATAPREALVHLQRAYRLEQQGENDKAILAYRRAATIDPSLMEAHANLGRLLLQKGQYREAAAALDKAVSLEPEALSIRFLRASAKFQINDFDIAIKDCEFIVARRFEGLSDPTSKAGVHFILGTAYGQIDRLADAERELQAALVLLPDSTAIRYNLGRVYVLRGEIKKARKEFQTILSQEPDHKDAKVALEVLNRKPEGATGQGSNRQSQVPFSLSQSILASILFIPGAFVFSMIMNFLLGLFNLAGLGIAALPGAGLDWTLNKLGLGQREGSSVSKFNWGIYVFTWAGPVYLLCQILLILLQAFGITLFTGLFVHWFPGATTAIRLLGGLWLWMAIGISGLIVYVIILWVLKLWLGTLGIFWSILSLIFTG